MLRFFRQIRKKLMEQNKVQTYLLYAIGEIALVMIGILLALQVNNWNEERKKQGLEVQTLKEIRTSFKLAVEQLDISARAFGGMEKDLSIVLETLKKTSSIPDTTLPRLRALFGYPTPKFNVSAYENLKNRGIDLISNEELKLSILNIYEVEFYYLIEELDNGLEAFSNETLSLQLTYLNLDFTQVNDNYDFGGVPVQITNYEKAINDPAFTNYLHYAHGYRLLGEARALFSKENVLQVIQQIDEELNILDQ